MTVLERQLQGDINTSINPLRVKKEWIFEMACVKTYGMAQ